MIAVLHPAGGSWRVLVAGTGRARPVVLEAREIAGNGTEARREIDALLDEHSVGRIITVLPASGVVCRTCTLPQADPAELDEALRLQAEATLLDRTPPHRLAMAVLAGSPGETSRCGIILAWPEAAAAINAPASEQEDGPKRLVTYAPDIAALVALMNGHRPADPLLWVDRHHAAVAMAITHASGAVFRCTREEMTENDGWERRVARAMGETALGVGHTEPFVVAQMEACERALSTFDPSDAAVSLPAEIIQSAAGRLEGAPRDDGDWWRTFGIAAGVALAAMSELGPLTALRKTPETARTSRIRRITETLSRPRAAMATAALCLLLLGLTPLVMAGVRLTILKMRYGDIDTQVRTVERTKTELAMYRALENNAWSMTKLLSDIVCNTPPGIEFHSVRVLHSDGSFAVVGEAIDKDGRNARENVLQMQEQLRATAIFSEIRLNWGGSNAFGQYDFELSAKITRPHIRPKYEMDQRYDVYNLAMRNANMPPPEEEDDTPPPVADDADDPGTRTPSQTPTPAAVDETPDPDADDNGSNGSSRRDRPAGLVGEHGGGRDRSNTDNRGGTGPGLGEIPEPLTEAQINAMSDSELRKQLTEIAQARKRIGTPREEDAEAKAVAERLKTEFGLIRDRLTGKGGGG